MMYLYPACPSNPITRYAFQTVERKIFNKKKMLPSFKVEPYIRYNMLMIKKITKAERQKKTYRPFPRIITIREYNIKRLYINHCTALHLRFVVVVVTTIGFNQASQI